MKAPDLQALAKRKLKAIERDRSDPRYRRVLGRYVAAGVLTTTAEVEVHRRPISVADALFAGRVEPRILELLPALIVKRPALFEDVASLPDDLAKVVHALRRNEEPPSFRGVAGKALLRWLPAVGRRGKRPSRLKAFRFQPDDSLLLDRLSRELGVTQTDVLRRALRELAGKHLLRDGGR